jgi:hypothetical protein
MSEFKPFLEIIGEMQNGDIAEAEAGGGAHIVRRGDAFYFQNFDKNYGGPNMKRIELNAIFFEPKYRIITQKSVSWGLAELELTQGKTVIFHHKNNAFLLNKDTNLDALMYAECITLNDLFLGKFTIQEEI